MREAHFPTGLTTGIGSLPHDDPRDAVRFVLDRFPRLPVAPSLPRRSPAEGMIAQAAWGVPGVRVLDDGSLLVDEAEVEPGRSLRDPGIDGEPFLGLRIFLDSMAGHTGWLKLQLTGPVTLGLALRALGVAAEPAFAVADLAVAGRIAALRTAVEAAVPDASPVVFLDEPGLCAALRPGFPLPVGDALDRVSSAMATVQSFAVAGLHCCGEADWHAVLQAGPQVLSAPVGVGVSEHAGAVADFLEAGGWIAWGAVPTEGPFTTSVDMLWRRLLTEWGRLVAGGCDPTLLRSRALITPACGLVGLDAYQTGLVADLTTGLGRRLELTLGGTLDLGA